ncbi:hypothetical protein PN36_27900 [Candidatus Thiomargarita nelsonii]|uniref:Uncharacterized protein n=1 Tax=Candidatus Thiomargarita nelsonii TaxID=1003181 RepID=A0A0A6P1X1_9GAMM|nr:hypothetical protein PN36_27900 [Candidatus Thiomargarita nelsonii]
MALAYQLGETVKVDLLTNGNLASPSNRLDLWAAVQLPDNTILFMNSQPDRPFSLEPQAFSLNLENPPPIVRLLEFKVPPGFGGRYSFYAVYVPADILSSTLEKNFFLFFTFCKQLFFYKVINHFVSALKI